MSIRVAGIPGSLREGSLNKGLLRAAVELAPAGMEIKTYTGLGDIPPYNEDVFVKGDPEAVAVMKTAISEADAVPISTPEYNYGVPGVLKKCHRLRLAPGRQICAELQARGYYGVLPWTRERYGATRLAADVCVHRDLRHAPAGGQDSFREHAPGPEEVT
jgi:hypothetical protein